MEIKHYQFALMMLLVMVVTASVIDYMKGYALSSYPQCFPPETLEECLEKDDLYAKQIEWQKRTLSRS
jgi:hypothetical protein